MKAKYFREESLIRQRQMQSLKIGIVAFLLLTMIADVNAQADGVYRNGADLNQSQRSIPDVLISIGGGENSQYAILVEKNTQQLSLYTHDGISYRQLYRMSCSTGEVPGAKMCSGDKKTPEGIYFFTKKFKKRDLTPIYGTRAFPIDYPNLMDRLAGKGGNSIWLHGTNKPLKARDSNGCVVLENADIEELEKYITLNRTPIIIVDKLTFALDASARNNAKEAINNFLLAWNEAFQKGTCQDYLSFYDPAYEGQILWWPDWQDLKNELEASELIFTISPKKISIFKHGNIHVVLFDEILKFSGKTFFIGSKKLFLRSKNNNFKIIGEKYQITSKNKKNLKKTNPHIEAYRKLIKMREEDRKIGRLIGLWECLLVWYRGLLSA